MDCSVAGDSIKPCSNLSTSSNGWSVVTKERPIMARYYGSRSSSYYSNDRRESGRNKSDTYAYYPNDRREYDKVGSGPYEMNGFREYRSPMINEDRNRACNLPVEIMEKEYPTFSGPERGRYPDLYTGASRQMNRDRAYLYSEKKPSKF